MNVISNKIRALGISTVVLLVSNYCRRFLEGESSVIGLIMVLTAVLAVVSMSYALFSAKCPACKTNLIIHSMRMNSASNWLVSIYEKEACPICGASLKAER